MHARGVRDVGAVPRVVRHLSRTGRFEAVPGTGLLRTVYFAILIPHVVLAAAVLPLAIVTLRRGLAMDVARHRKIAKITLPIWLFVSVTGVVVY